MPDNQIKLSEEEKYEWIDLFVDLEEDEFNKKLESLPEEKQELIANLIFTIFFPKKETGQK